MSTRTYAPVSGSASGSAPRCLNYTTTATPSCWSAGCHRNSRIRCGKPSANARRAQFLSVTIHGRNLELDGSLRLLLHHDRPRCDGLTMADIPHSQVDEVPGSKFAVEGQVEQGEFATPNGKLQWNTNRPDLLAGTTRTRLASITIIRAARRRQRQWVRRGPADIPPRRSHAPTEVSPAARRSVSAAQVPECHARMSFGI